MRPLTESKASIMLLKLMEAAFCLICLILHIKAYFQREKHLPYETIYSGAHFGFLMYAIFGIVSIYLNVPLSIIIEAISSAVASVIFISIAMIIMGYVERDPDLVYLTDEEELADPFFAAGRCQSMFSLVSAFIFAVHSALMWDMLYITEPNINEPDEASQPLQLHYFPYDVVRYAKRFLPENIQRQFDFTVETGTHQNIDKII